MALNTTLLQFGYIFSLVMWLIFNVRGYKYQRLSDNVLGWIMFILAMELQDYTFGFAGINLLWEEYNGFPREVSLLLGPTVYFYFKSQINRSFKLVKKHIWHLLPYVLFLCYKLFFFLQGQASVEAQQDTVLDESLTIIYQIFLMGTYIYYFYKCLVIYRNYRKWSIQQFSNIETISFIWFRNFIYAMILWLVTREVMRAVDDIYDLSFYEDWWWNLVLVGVSFYIGLTGYSQIQPAKLECELDTDSTHDTVSNSTIIGNIAEKVSAPLDSDKLAIAAKIGEIMENDRLYLQSDLSLQELAQHSNLNTVELSAVINQVFNYNFNDYVNSLRIEYFIALYKNDENRKLTMLAIAFDSGFNSKATFNRSFKKIKGVSPSAFFDAGN